MCRGEGWDGEDRRTENSVRQVLRKQTILLAAVLFSLFVSLGAIAYGVAQDVDERKEESDRLQADVDRRVQSQRFGVELLGCILEQFAEHRENDSFAHDQIAGRPLKKPNDVPGPEDLAQFQRACDQFIRPVPPDPNPSITTR